MKAQTSLPLSTTPLHIQTFNTWTEESVITNVIFFVHGLLDTSNTFRPLSAKLCDVLTENGVDDKKYLLIGIDSPGI